MDFNFSFIDEFNKMISNAAQQAKENSVEYRLQQAQKQPQFTEGLASNIATVLPSNAIAADTITPAEYMLRTEKDNVPSIGSNEYLPYSTKDLDYSGIWGQHYHTNPTAKMIKKFNDDVTLLAGNAPKEKGIRSAIDKVIPAFGGELKRIGWAPEDFKELMYRTALHESLGGEHDTNTAGSSARGWFQVMPQTVMDTLKNYRGSLGKEFTKATGYTPEQLDKLDHDQMKELLRTDPNLGAAMGALQYIRSLTTTEKRK